MSRGAGLPEALERAASALPAYADSIRPANGDPTQLLQLLGVDAAVRILEWLLVNDLDAGAELASAWVEDEEGGAEPLVRANTGLLPKAAQKVLRRAHHRLRSRGVAVPADDLSGRVVRLPPVGDELSAAMVSPLDPRGTRIAYLVEPNPSGGARLFEVMLDEQRGIMEFDAYTTGRSKVRKLLRDFSLRESFPGVAAPPEAVRALVERIAAHQPPDRPLPRSFSEWRSRVAAPPEGTATPGELAREGVGGEPGAGPEAAERLGRAAELVREREVGPWPPAAEVLQAIAERIAEVARSPIIVSGPRRREQVRQVLDEGLGEIFAEPFATRTAERFEETAYILWKRDRLDDARACLAAARAFREVAPADNPVANAMLEVPLAPVLGKLEEEAEEREEESLLVKP